MVKTLIVNYFLDLGVLHLIREICYNKDMLKADVTRALFKDNASSMRPPPGRATGFGSTITDYRIIEKLTAADIDPGEQTMVAGVQNAATEEAISAKRNKRERNERARYGIASVTGAIITREIFDDISEYVDNQIDRVKDDLMANRAEQAVVKAEIEATDTEISAADTDRHIAQVRAMRAADQLSMVKLRETELGEKWESVGSIDEAIALSEEERRLQEERAKAERNCDRTQETLDDKTRRVAEIMERRRELEDNLKRLENDETGLQARYDQLNSFREYMRTDAMQEKLENGTLTLEDLQAGGAPQDVLDMAKEKLEAGGTLTREDLRAEMKDGYRQIAAETRSVMGTSYASNYDLDGTRLAEAPPMAEQFLTAAAERIDSWQKWWNSSPAPDQPQTQIATAPAASGPSGMA